MVPTLSLLLFIAGCSDDSSRQNRYDGTWKLAGYAMTLSIKHGKVKSYQTTRDTAIRSLLLDGTIEGDRLATELLSFSVQLQNGKLVLTDRSSGVEYRADKVSAIKPATMDQLTDARYNFDIFWQAFNEHYAFFELYGVDWEALRSRYAAKIYKETSAADLFVILSDLVRGLNDQHVGLSLKDSVFEPYRDAPDWYEQMPRLEQIVQRNYVHDLRQPSEALHYGWLNAETGYIKLRHMIADANAEKALALMLPVFDQALAQLQTAKTLVIDIRFNQGGYDAVSRAYAGTLSESKRVAMLKQAREGSEYTPLQPISTEPRGNVRYRGRIVLLTSKVTVSAGETFAQAMRQLPNVTIVGERTAGFFSDAMTLQLPNGITFRFSNERYFTPDGRLLEGQGIQPDTEAPFDPQLIPLGKDPALDWVLSHPAG